MVYIAPNDVHPHSTLLATVFYQLAMLTCLAAECTATYSLAKYTALQDHIEDYSNHRAKVKVHDILVAESMTICFSVFVATLFGADFFFLLFWPRRLYPLWYNTTKKALAVAITGGVFASAVLSNVRIAFLSHLQFPSGTMHRFPFKIKICNLMG